VLYDEKSAKDIGKRLGAQFVCISEITKDEGEILIACKLINVETGAARTKSGLSSKGNKEVMSASTEIIKYLLGMGGSAQIVVEAPAKPAPPRSKDRGDVYAVILYPLIDELRYWKNGQEVPAFRFDGFGTGSLFQSGGNKYHAGKYDKRLAIYKNDKLLHYLTDGKQEGDGTCVIVSNGSVYFCGYEVTPKGNRAMVWKNGNVIHHLTDGNTEAKGCSLFISGNDVYVGGYEVNPQGKAIATVWKNGSVHWRLTDGRYGHAEVLSLFVSGNDVYAAGYERNPQSKRVATIWKNGAVLCRLTGDNAEGKIYSIFVSGGDLYALGLEGDTKESGVATVWKNGSALYRMDNCSFDGSAGWLVFVR
jgi:hypothetical protein